ncbi:MAG: EAL domain-containing protein [Gammaproteobacteria bacterium]|nr:EAL domain-containing protein [Gammaproteobacteria bacterium]
MSQAESAEQSDVDDQMPRRTLVREVLITQLVFAAVVGVIALGCVWWVTHWVVRDNLGDWSTRWIGEMEALGEGLYREGDEGFLSLDSYIARFPEIRYVRYYSPRGKVIYVESKDQGALAFAPLDRAELQELEIVALENVAYRVDESLDPLVRINQAVVTESIVRSNLFAAESVDELETSALVVGFVELGLDYGRYDQQLFDSVFTGSVFVLFGFLALTVVGRIVLRRAMQPLADVTRPLLRMAKGDLDITVPVSPHREIAAISSALKTAATKIRERDQRMLRLANFDALTGLANRHHFMETLTEWLDKLADDGGTGAVLFVDLDKFKYVNDTAGHEAGDRVLAQTAERLRQAARKQDVVGRHGGDEFVMFACDVTVEEADEIANRMVRDLREHPLSYGDQSFNVACSVGIAMVLEDNVFTAAELVSQADLACRQAKTNGRDRAQVFQVEAGQIESIRNDVASQQALRDALKEDRFVLHFQPIMHLASGEVRHYEVLLRLSDGDQLHYPNTFLTAAIRFDLMRDIDRWVIGHALEQLAEHRATQPELTFCVNINGASMDGTIADFVAGELERNDLPPSALVLEITEQVAIGSFSEVADQIHELVELGCKFAVDNFGTGYSSLSYLERLPVQYIKIDGVFIGKLTQSKVDESIVRAIADIARLMGKSTMAEFVGDAATLDVVRDIGIDYAQGFHIGKPGPIPEQMSVESGNTASGASGGS